MAGRTALAAAFHRAAHQAIERGAIFTDPLALGILGIDEADIRERVQNTEVSGSRRMRIFIAVRHRFAEDAIAASGSKQVVILGAGLDTFAYRQELRHSGPRVFEVDHPSTQAWKRGRLTEAGIVVPESLTFSAVDFEKETLADGLAAAGFDREAATFFTWLGVVPYLTSEAIWSTLGFIAGLPGGAQVVFDYANPPESFEGEAPRCMIAGRHVWRSWARRGRLTSIAKIYTQSCARQGSRRPKIWVRGRSPNVIFRISHRGCRSTAATSSERRRVGLTIFMRAQIFSRLAGHHCVPFGVHYRHYARQETVRGATVWSALTNGNVGMSVMNGSRRILSRKRSRCQELSNLKNRLPHKARSLSVARLS